MSKRQTDHLTVADAYFNDYVTDKHGNLHAQGSHDINRVASNYNADGTKKAWHDKVATRRQGYKRARDAQNNGETRKVYCLPVKRNGRTVYALDAIVRKSDGKVLRCSGWSDRPRREPTSKLGKVCAR